MPFDYALREPRLTTLLRGAQLRGQSEVSDAFLDSCINAGHRQHFFVPAGQALRRRGQTIFNQVETCAPGLVSQSAKPGKQHWQAFCEGRPLSLSAILKIDDVLQAIAAHPDPAVREHTMTGGAPLRLTAGSVVASIYYIDPERFAEARERHGSARDKLSWEIFKIRDTLTLIERGENGKHVRLTDATVDKICAAMGEEIRTHFTHRHDVGPRNGENTFALGQSRGNICSYTGKSAGPSLAIA